MTFKLNNDKTVAVATDYYWQPMHLAPMGVRVLVLPVTGVARFDELSSKTKDAVAWAPLPKRDKWLIRAERETMEQLFNVNTRKD